MLRFERSDDRNILIISADGPLKETDFKEFARQIVANTPAPRPLHLMLRTESFPGWESFEAFEAHLRFVSEHHRRIEKIAVVTDSTLLKVLPHIASLLVHPKIKHFDLAETNIALTWLEISR
ncbi:STAS/SEC14 domain-containing protein [Rhizobium sp. RAF56]|uniref:STAS/SEC14 domain-containing protein n=1 Tax=Rhizobium sp. RAF56 TaxID=3233062 RepID=UPI003F9D67AD